MIVQIKILTLFKSKNYLHITNKKLKINKNNNKNIFLKKALKFLYNKEISSILVEGEVLQFNNL